MRGFCYPIRKLCSRSTTSSTISRALSASNTSGAQTISRPHPQHPLFAITQSSASSAATSAFSTSRVQSQPASTPSGIVHASCAASSAASAFSTSRVPPQPVRSASTLSGIVHASSAASSAASPGERIGLQGEEEGPVDGGCRNPACAARERALRQEVESYQAR